MKRLHILGIGGTFMAGLAVLARQAGYVVSGQDGPLHPPMSTLLAETGIAVHEGYDGLIGADPAATVVIGNALGRGNPAVEATLDHGLDYTSGPDWLARHILPGRWVIAVAGTHGKTTTASLIAWLLDCAGLAPGFLIGGLPRNFATSARLGEAPFFVIEADEYDSAFFDKRSKFVHFRPQTLVLNNLEYDHADIFADLAAIEQQFQHLVRTVPGRGGIVFNHDDAALARVLAAGCWSERIGFGGSADAAHRLAPGAAGWVLDGTPLTAPLPGRHNAMNSAAALLAARHAGVPLSQSAAALGGFEGVCRRLEKRGEAGGITLLDDFAHHPSAIAASLAALRGEKPRGRLLAVLEPRSNSMRRGVHADALAAALADADAAFVLAEPGLGWDVDAALAPLGEGACSAAGIDQLVARVAGEARPGDTVVVMSNGPFGGIHERLLAAFATAQGAS